MKIFVGRPICPTITAVLHLNPNGGITSVSGGIATTTPQSRVTALGFRLQPLVIHCRPSSHPACHSACHPGSHKVGRNAAHIRQLQANRLQGFPYREGGACEGSSNWISSPVNDIRKIAEEKWRRREPGL